MAQAGHTEAKYCNRNSGLLFSDFSIEALFVNEMEINEVIKHFHIKPTILSQLSASNCYGV